MIMIIDSTDATATGSSAGGTVVICGVTFTRVRRECVLTMCYLVVQRLHSMLDTLVAHLADAILLSFGHRYLFLAPEYAF